MNNNMLRYSYVLFTYIRVHIIYISVNKLKNKCAQNETIVALISLLEAFVVLNSKVINIFKKNY